MRKIIATAVACVMLAALAGCNRKPTANPQAEKTNEKPPTAADTFEPPSPVGAENDGRVLTLKATTERITAALTGVRDRLKDIQQALEVKAKTESDLARVAGQLKTLTGRAREDCDAILRAAEDLQANLPAAQKGYAQTADFYRERAAGYRDPSLKAINLRMADEFERLAAATPHRVRLTERFIAQLVEVRLFLAQADQCLGDTKTALEILSAGPTPVTVSAESKAFRRHLENFLAVIEDYQQKLLAPPPEGTSWDRTTPPRPDCPPPPPFTDAALVTDPNAPARNVYQPYRCEKCGRLHVGVYRVSPDDPIFARTSGSYTAVGHEREYAPQQGGR